MRPMPMGRPLHRCSRWILSNASEVSVPPKSEHAIAFAFSFNRIVKASEIPFEALPLTMADFIGIDHLAGKSFPSGDGSFGKFR